MAALDDSERTRLVAAYRQTAYRISLPGKPAVLRIDVPWAAVDPRLTHGLECLAYITAANPASQALDDAENARRLRALLDDIMALGSSAQSGIAVADDGNWPDEPGFLVADLPIETARALAVRYGQNAFLHARTGDAVRLIWCGT